VKQAKQGQRAKSEATTVRNFTKKNFHMTLITAQFGKILFQ